MCIRDRLKAIPPPIKKHPKLYKKKLSIIIEYAVKRDAKHVPIDAKIKPNFRPIILINFAAKKANKAIPTTDKAIGRVAKDFIGLNFEPMMPLKKNGDRCSCKSENLA